MAGDERVRRRYAFTVITLFHVLTFGFCLMGLIGGGILGHASFGWWGTFAGALFGAYAGLVIGRLFRLLAATAWCHRDKPSASGKASHLE